MTRHELREAIFKTIFQMPFFDEGIPELNSDEEFISEFISEYKPSENNKVYIMSKVKDISDNLSSIDECIEKNSNGWKLARIGKSELAILRVAVYEILFDDDIPDKVAINEAVELAKEYAGDKSASFINGVLSGLVL
ncbi:MAG TPA: transcription antitermination factor NusB [Lachnospiraceae bacterium]|jgi:N utilization substance protein B|nr:transcription antitermination factor NusB [Lachnospiraceae bacterium]